VKKMRPAMTLWIGLCSISAGLSLSSCQVQIPASQYAIPSDVFKTMAVPQIDPFLILDDFRESESLKGKIGRDGAFRVRVSRQGGFIVEIGKEAYIFEESRMTSENPSLFAAQGKSRLGWMAEDAALRLQLAMKSSARSVRMFVERFGLPAGRSYTFQPLSIDHRVIRRRRS
jgi:hypothetical protein